MLLRRTLAVKTMSASTATSAPSVVPQPAAAPLPDGLPRLLADAVAFFDRTCSVLESGIVCGDRSAAAPWRAPAETMRQATNPRSMARQNMGAAVRSASDAGSARDPSIFNLQFSIFNFQ